MSVVPSQVGVRLVPTTTVTLLWSLVDNIGCHDQAHLAGLQCALSARHSDHSRPRILLDSYINNIADLCLTS